MKMGKSLAIHNTSWGFTPDWIAYCRQHNIPFKLVNCYDDNIIEQLRECNALLWHYHHADAKDRIFASQLLFSLQQTGFKVFPDLNTSWHFDDKVGQKYLLESIDAPLATTYVFYDRQKALNWAKESSFPKVFKLRSGAGSSNVRLIKNLREAEKIIKRAFGRGFNKYNKWGDFSEKWRLWKNGIIEFRSFLKSLRRLITSTEYARIHGYEKGYVYFQDFIPNNEFDIRVVVIGEKAFAIKRLVRKDDFRASGSGYIEYDKDSIDLSTVKIALGISDKLDLQCQAYDFVFDSKGKPLIVEINYGFDHTAYFKCPGYWDKELNWHEESFNSSHWIVEMFIHEC